MLCKRAGCGCGALTEPHWGVRRQYLPSRPSAFIPFRLFASAFPPFRLFAFSPSTPNPLSAFSPFRLSAFPEEGKTGIGKIVRVGEKREKEKEREGGRGKEGEGGQGTGCACALCASRGRAVRIACRRARGARYKRTCVYLCIYVCAHVRHAMCCMQAEKHYRRVKDSGKKRRNVHVYACTCMCIHT